MSDSADPEMARLNTLANLLDNQFRIPGTNMRFGLDALIGLIPYVGDMAGLIVSAYLFRLMIKRGAGPVIMLRMLGNSLLDTAIGIVPVVGDLFDFGFKSNRRNVNLLQKYYADPTKPRPNAKWSLFLLGIVFLAILIGFIWLIGRAVAALWAMIPG
jgi:Domain of unknown function (DUF4112)